MQSTGMWSRCFSHGIIKLVLISYSQRPDKLLFTK